MKGQARFPTEQSARPESTVSLPIRQQQIVHHLIRVSGPVSSSSYTKPPPPTSSQRIEPGNLHPQKIHATQPHKPAGTRLEPAFTALSQNDNNTHNYRVTHGYSNRALVRQLTTKPTWGHKRQGQVATNKRLNNKSCTGSGDKPRPLCQTFQNFRCGGGGGVGDHSDLSTVSRQRVGQQDLGCPKHSNKRGTVQVTYGKQLHQNPTLDLLFLWDGGRIHLDPFYINDIFEIV